jgi:hypothetical protein
VPLPERGEGLPVAASGTEEKRFDRAGFVAHHSPHTRRTCGPDSIVHTLTAK